MFFFFTFFFFSEKYFGIFRKNRENRVKKSRKFFFAKKKKKPKSAKSDSLQNALNLIFSKTVAYQRLFFSLLKKWSKYDLGIF